MNTRRLITGLALITLLLPGVARSQPLADRVPADAFVYVGWSGADGLQDAFQNSRLKAFMAATEFANLFSQMSHTLRAAAQQAEPDAAEALDRGTEVASFFWKYPSAVYFSGDLEEERPKALVICKAGVDCEKLQNLIEPLVADAGTEEDPVLVRIVDGTVVLSAGFQAIDPALKVVAAKSLAADEGFKHCVGKTRENPAYTIYLNIERMMQMLDVAAQRDGELATWKKMREALGLDGIKRFMWSSGFKGPLWGSSIFFEVPAPRKGLAAILDSKPITPETLKLIPKSATWAKGISFDLGHLFDTIKNTAAQVDADAHAEFMDGMRQANQMVGIDIENDLLKALGSQWILYSDAGAPGKTAFNAQLVIANKVNNAAKLERAMTTLQNMAGNFMPMPGGPGPGGGGQLQEIGGAKVHSIPLGPQAVQWTIHKDTLLISLAPAGLAEAIAQLNNGGESVLANPGFAALRGRLDVLKTKTVTFVDLPRCVPVIYQSIAAVLPMAQMMLMQQFPDMKPMVLPLVEKITPHLSSAAGMGWVDDEGYHSRFISPFPGATLMSPDLMTDVSVPAIGVAILLPAISSARAAAQEVASSSQLRAIHLVMTQYAQEKGVFPKDIATLCFDEFIEVDVVLSPRDKTRTPAGFENSARERKRNWINLNSSYVILVLGQNPNVNAQKIVGFEKFGRGTRNIPLVFADGHVETLPAGQARQRIEKETGKSVEELQGGNPIN